MPKARRSRRIAEMVKRRMTRFAESDSEDEPTEFPQQAKPQAKKLKLQEEEEEEKPEEEPFEEEEADPEEEPEASSEGEDGEEVVAKPIGEVIKVSGKGRGKREHYKAFEYDGNRFELEDSVLLTPEENGQKPYVAIIKDITQGRDKNMMVTGQWFYRPEEAEKQGGGSWEPRDTRELFYSFHRDEVPAESVMHKCVAHFVPEHKQFPNRKVNPGFFVQKVYDTDEKKLWGLTEKDYEDNKQHEIDLLVQKTRECLGKLPDLETKEVDQNINAETEDASNGQEEQLKKKRTLRRKNMLHLDVSRDDSTTNRSDQHTDTPGSYTGDASEFYAILATFKALSGDTVRDKWLERLLQGVQFVCDSNVDAKNSDKEKMESEHNATVDNQSKVTDTSKISKGGGNLCWPDAAVAAVVAVESAAHDALNSDFLKYNQKMRQLVFNLKNNALLARRMVSGELEASVIPYMSPNELKDGLTAQETTTKEPDESERIQMTDARCSRCTEKKVGLTDIIQAGGRGDRYQLECVACGNTWYAFRDEISTLTIDAPSDVGNVGTAPWATAKFEDVEKKTKSPREPEKVDAELFKKTTAPAPYIPVLEKQKSFNRQRTEDPST